MYNEMGSAILQDSRVQANSLDALVHMLYGIRCVCAHGSADETLAPGGALGTANKMAEDQPQNVRRIMEPYIGGKFIHRNSILDDRVVHLAVDVYSAQSEALVKFLTLHLHLDEGIAPDDVPGLPVGNDDDW